MSITISQGDLLRMLEVICPGDPHQRNPNAPKFEDRSQEETERQERCVREAAWRLAKSVLKFKEHERATFFSPSENWCLLASTLKPEEREFVVDSGASMHVISKKDLRGQSLCQRIGHILDNETPRGYASSSVAGKALR